MKYRIQRNFGKKGFDIDVLRAMREAAERGETPDAMRQFLGYKKKYANEYSAYLNNNSPKFTNKAAEDFYQKWKKEADDLLRRQRAQREAAARESAARKAAAAAEKSKDTLKGKGINKKLVGGLLIGGGLLAAGALIRRKIKKDKAQQAAQSEIITE